MPPILASGRPAVVVRGKLLLPGQHGCGSLRRYSARSSRKWVRRANVAEGPGGYARRMRTNRGRQRFYAAGWGISAGVMIVASRLWLLHLREVEHRADEAERTRDEAAQRRAMEERLRIARELHDSLTHSISVICVQAGVAAHLARKRGEDVPPALLAIQEAGTDAAGDLRTTLERAAQRGGRRLQRPGPAGPPGGPATGRRLPVTVTVTGTQRPLPPEADEAAYRDRSGSAHQRPRRHAGRACARVHLHLLTDALSVQVDDDGTGASTSTSTGSRPAAPGLGLIRACGNG